MKKLPLSGASSTTGAATPRSCWEWRPRWRCSRGRCVVGESVRESLRRIALRQLGRTEQVVEGGRFFREALGRPARGRFPERPPRGPHGSGDPPVERPARRRGRGLRRRREVLGLPRHHRSRRPRRARRPRGRGPRCGAPERSWETPFSSACRRHRDPGQLALRPTRHARPVAPRQRAGHAARGQPRRVLAAPAAAPGERAVRAARTPSDSLGVEGRVNMVLLGAGPDAAAARGGGGVSRTWACACASTSAGVLVLESTSALLGDDVVGAALRGGEEPAGSRRARS